MLKKIAAIGMTALLSTPVLAQEQTVESAQKFLELSLGGLTANSEFWLYNNTPALIDRRGAIKKVETVQRCVSSFAVEYPRFTSNERRHRRLLSDGRLSSPAVWNATTRTVMLDASRLTQVETIERTYPKEKYLRLSITGRGSSVHLYGPETLVARVGYALEFLRQQCDPAAATGF